MQMGYTHAVGLNSNSPPLFDGHNFSSWRSRMEFWIASREPRCLGIIRNGPLLHRGLDLKVESGSMTSLSDEEAEIIKLNAMAVNFLHCALSPMEYNRISACTTAKEIWDRLVLTHEGTDQVKETRVNLFVQQYESFKMKTDEPISEMYDRLNTIINNLALLGKTYTNAELVRKVLRSLPITWENKKTAIEEAKDLTTLKLDQLMGSLLSYEEEKRSSEPQKTKSIAFKAATSNDDESNDLEAESDDELSLLVKGLNKLIYKRRFKRSAKPKSSNSEDKKGPICYECRKPGHMRNECPLLSEKQKPSRNRRKALAAWSDEEDTASEPEETQKTNNCYMARSKSESNSDEEVSSTSVSISSSNKLNVFLTELLEKVEGLSLKYQSVKRQNRILQSHVTSLQRENATLIKEAKIPCTEASSLTTEPSSEKWDEPLISERVIHSSNETNEGLSSSSEYFQNRFKCSSDACCTTQKHRSVLNLKKEQKHQSVTSCTTSQKHKTVQCCSSVQNNHSTKVENHACLVRKAKVCFYCGMLGHLVGQCQIKRSMSISNAIFSRDKSQVYGTILKWVPIPT